MSHSTLKVSRIVALELGLSIEQRQLSMLGLVGLDGGDDSNLIVFGFGFLRGIDCAVNCREGQPSEDGDDGDYTKVP